MKSWWFLELLECIRKDSAKEILGVLRGKIVSTYVVEKVNLFCPTHLKPTRAPLGLLVHEKNMKEQFGNGKKILHSGKTLLLFNPPFCWIWHFSEHFGLYLLPSLSCACPSPNHRRGGRCRWWECELCFTLANLRDPPHC